MTLLIENETEASLDIDIEKEARSIIEFVLDKTHREPGRINGTGYLRKNIGNGAYVILVSVGNDEALELVIILLDIRYIGNYEVNSQHVILRKCESAIHDDNTVFVFEGSDVHSDLFKPTQRDDLKLGRRNLFVIITQYLFSFLLRKKKTFAVNLLRHALKRCHQEDPRRPVPGRRARHRQIRSRICSPLRLPLTCP